MATVSAVRDENSEVVAPMILPVKVPERQGRRPAADRVCCEAIEFVMITGIAWGHLPGEPGWSAAVAGGSHIRALQGGLDQAISG